MGAKTTSPETGRKPGGFFTEKPLTLCASGVLLGYLAGLTVDIYRRIWPAHPAPLDHPCIDFIWMWLSGKFAASSLPSQIYDYSAFTAAQKAVYGQAACFLEHFDYPPTVLFFTEPLSFVPYSVAFPLWIAATLPLYLAAVYAIIPHRTAVIAALAPFPVWFTVLLGHNGFLSAGLVGFALVFAERRPWLAGLCLGLLTYKPQLGILFLPALAISRNWRALAAAGVASILFAALAAIAFGYQSWPAFFRALIERAAAVSDDPHAAMPLVSLLSLYSLGVSSTVAWTLQLLAAAFAVAVVCILWAKAFPYPLKAAALAIGSLIVSPHVHGYDVCILTIGAAYFIKDGLSRGFLPGERGALLLSWLGLFLLSGPIPAMISLALLGLVARRAIRLGFRERASDSVAPARSAPLRVAQASR
jgi:hypothetical protein